VQPAVTVDGDPLAGIVLDMLLLLDLAEMLE
jgi:hypothetical protein